MGHADDPIEPALDADPEAYVEEALEEMIEHADHAFAAESFGTTAAEQLRGPSFDQRLSEEGTDELIADGAFEIEDLDAPDEEPRLVGEGGIHRDPFPAAEDLAMTVRDDAPGHVDHPDDYLEPAPQPDAD